MRGTIALAVVAICAGCAAPDAGAPHLVERARVAMGSELRLSAWTADETAAQAAFDGVFAEFDRLESLLSVWREGSDVLRMNAAAGDHAIVVSAETREVLAAARRVSDVTGGRFDITFGALTDIWRFDHDQDNHVPGPSEIQARLPLIDYRAVAVDHPPGTAFVGRKGMRVHLGGIGKGYAVDRAIALLRSRGLQNVMIQAGGDLYVSGHKDDAPWRLGIADPRGPAGQVFATLDLSDGALSTSGDYERFFMKDGRRYHHLLDPRTGEPARLCRSVSIVADSATLADGLSTGVFILGSSDGMALIERLDHVEGVIVTATNEVLISSGLKGKVRIVAKPTDAP